MTRKKGKTNSNVESRKSHKLLEYSQTDHLKIFINSWNIHNIITSKKVHCPLGNNNPSTIFIGGAVAGKG